MDQNPKSLTHLIMSKLQKKKITTHLLFSIPLFSIFFLNSFNFHSSRVLFPFQLISQMMNKNYIFVLFNGIVVFLAKTSYGFINSNLHTNDQFLIKKIGENFQLLEREVLGEISNPQENFVIQEEEKGEIEFGLVGEGKENGNVVLSIEGEDENEKEREKKSGFFVDEEEEEVNLGLSREELNKKFDDFIRKMKEEIRIQAQGPLIMV